MKKIESCQAAGLDRKWLCWVGWSEQVFFEGDLGANDRKIRRKDL